MTLNNVIILKLQIQQNIEKFSFIILCINKYNKLNIQMGYDYYLNMISRIYDQLSMNVINYEHSRFQIDDYFYSTLYNLYGDNVIDYEDGVYCTKLDNVYNTILINMQEEQLYITNNEKTKLDEYIKALNIDENKITITHLFKFTFRNDDKIIMINDNITI